MENKKYSFINNKLKIKYGFILLIISILSIFLSFKYFIEFSSFSVGITKYILSLFLWYYIDKFFLDDIDTIKLVSANPISYAIFLLANALILGLCISTS